MVETLSINSVTFSLPLPPKDRMGTAGGAGLEGEVVCMGVGGKRLKDSERRFYGMLKRPTSHSMRVMSQQLGVNSLERKAGPLWTRPRHASPVSSGAGHWEKGRATWDKSPFLLRAQGM